MEYFIRNCILAFALLVAGMPPALPLPSQKGSAGEPTYSDAVAQALRYQMQADSMQRTIEARVLELSATVAEAQRKAIRTAIGEDTERTAELQQKAGEWFSKAAALDTTSATVHAASLADILEPEFDILPRSPYTAANPVPVDHPLPDGVVYKIQLGAFGRAVPANTFRGLTPISAERADNGIIKYYAGIFGRFADAADALRKVHQYGFKDAYVVAFLNSRNIHLERAKQLEGVKN